MCQQLTVLKKIHSKGAVNGYAVELAEAQAKDFVKMEKRITNIEKTVADIKTEQAAQGGKIDTILSILNGPTEGLKKKGIVAEAILPLFKSWKFWTLALFFLCCVALAGDKILELLRILPVGA